MNGLMFNGTPTETENTGGAAVCQMKVRES